MIINKIFPTISGLCGTTITNSEFFQVENFLSGSNYLEKKYGRYETFMRQNNIYSGVYSNYKQFYYKHYSIKPMNTFNKSFFAYLKTTHSAFTCSKLTIETLEQGVKYAQS